MREILFRAKRINNEEWEYGYYAELGAGDNWKYYIIQNFALCGLFSNTEDNMVFNGIEVDLETVCQYTGLKDKNGTKIFEGDICQCKGFIGTVVYEEGSFKVRWNTLCMREDIEWWYTNKNFKVIGNIFDNSEPLERK